MSIEVPLVAVALTWRDAGTAVRERAALPVDAALYAALRTQGVDGLVELHTCARSLWIAAGGDAAWIGGLLQSCVAARTEGAVMPAVRTGEEAARHALRVAVGLDSYVQGESDIGGQFLAAFDGARAAGRSAAGLNLLQQSAARLLSDGREHGYVRPNRGVGALAVSALLERGVDLSVPVGIVGAGSIGRRVVGALERAGAAAPVVYNRSPRGDALPLASIDAAGHAAWVVCTAGPPGWFVPPPAARWVIDLGMPAQVRPAAVSDGVEAPALVGLDALLAGDPLRLPEERIRAAEDAVEREIGALSGRLGAIAWRRQLAGSTQLRDRFLEEDLERLLGEALDGLPERRQRRVRDATRRAVRQYNHRMLTWIKQALDPAVDAGPDGREEA